MIGKWGYIDGPHKCAIHLHIGRDRNPEELYGRDWHELTRSVLNTCPTSDYSRSVLGELMYVLGTDNIFS